MEWLYFLGVVLLFGSLFSIGWVVRRRHSKNARELVHPHKLGDSFDIEGMRNQLARLDNELKRLHEVLGGDEKK